MKYTTLPKTDIKVSKICLGTMTWGKQNTEAEGHEQMDYALERGVNFFDTAELYAIPKERETQGETERIIGKWFKNTGNRDKIILASKIAGPSRFNKHYIRTGAFSKENIEEAVHGSLKRLQTDYIDLYQLHWPDRMTNCFGNRNYRHNENDQWQDQTLEILEALNDLIKQGKIRHIGLSNETAWGAMHYLHQSRMHDLREMITVQNPYNLLNRIYEIGLAEVSMRENIGLLPYSPLAFGRLTNKFIEKKGIENARITLFPEMSRYNGKKAIEAAQLYYDLATENDMSLATMALAFVNAQPFVTSNIIGATSMDQLKENINSIDVELSQELLKKIETIFESIPNPAP